MDPVRPKNVATMGTASSNSHVKKNKKEFTKFRMLYDKGVSKNRGTPKWMVYNGKPYKIG